MCNGMATIIAALVPVVVLLSSPVRAETYYPDHRPAAEKSSAEAIAIDALVVRPAGIVATAVGTAVFIVSLPFGLLTGSTEEAAQKLIGEPARYTFVRPLGQGIKPAALEQ